LSVVPYVYYKERPTGDRAGEFLQPIKKLPELPSVSGAAPSLPLGPAGKKPTSSPAEG
jgi:hypothetical protein